MPSPMIPAKDENAVHFPSDHLAAHQGSSEMWLTEQQRTQANKANVVRLAGCRGRHARSHGTAPALDRGNFQAEGATSQRARQHDAKVWRALVRSDDESRLCGGALRWWRRQSWPNINFWPETTLLHKTRLSAPRAVSTPARHEIPSLAETAPGYLFFYDKPRQTRTCFARPKSTSLLLRRVRACVAFHTTQGPTPSTRVQPSRVAVGLSPPRSASRPRNGVHSLPRRHPRRSVRHPPQGGRPDSGNVRAPPCTCNGDARSPCP